MTLKFILLSPACQPQVVEVPEAAEDGATVPDVLNQVPGAAIKFSVGKTKYGFY
jgi:hypothetical protein